MGDRELYSVAGPVREVLADVGMILCESYEGGGGRADFVVEEGGVTVFYLLRFGNACAFPDPGLSDGERALLERAMVSWIVERGLTVGKFGVSALDVAIVGEGRAVVRRPLFV